MTNRRFGVRRVLGLAVVLGAVTVVLGSVGLAGGATKPGKAQYQYGNGAKVTICHKGKVTIRVSVNAWPAHHAHGDVAGACANARAGGASAKAKAKAKAKAPKGADEAESRGNGNGNNGNGKAKGKG